uniref:Transmembrane protein 129, E3 ubiquitin ligase n=1 Tax=Sus scrofa TaxID=9823 RepID=A0A8D1PNA6_PIG
MDTCQAPGPRGRRRDVPSAGSRNCSPLRPGAARAAGVWSRADLSWLSLKKESEKNTDVEKQHGKLGEGRARTAGSPTGRRALGWRTLPLSWEETTSNSHTNLEQRPGGTSSDVFLRSPPERLPIAGCQTAPTLTSLSGPGLDESFLVQRCPLELKKRPACCPCWDLRSGYYVGMCFAASEKRLYSPSQAPETWRLFLLLALTLPTAACALIYHWSRDRWAHHPLARALALYAPPQSGWRAVASSVNTEFRRIDKFATGAPGARVIVTDTWVMKVTTYRVHVAQQQDVHLTVTQSQQHDLSPDSNLPVQLLTIRVASASPAVPAFDIRLNSTEYGELCEKLRAPIRSAANVVIRQSLGDLFLETFASLVEANPAYSVPSSQDLEACIGCMQTRASVKLVKTCQEAAEGACQQCSCRPMWCLTCMGKWFASRQDPQRPDTWLASRVPCPTCRARFCILDVCAVR